MACLLVGLGALVPSAASAASSYTAIALGTLPGGNTSSAFGINDRGEIVGGSGTASGRYHAFSYTRSGGMVDLGTLPGGPDSYAHGINDRGQIVGESGTASGAQHAFSYTRSGGMVDLGTLPGGRNSGASAINDRGQIVGVTNNGEVFLAPFRATLWQPTQGNG